jgi:hypothetical protein
MTIYANNTPMTAKQLEALRVIANVDNGGEAQDLDSIISLLRYKTTKQSFQFTIRSLIKRELITKLDRECVRGKSRRLLAITPLGMNKLYSEDKLAEKPADPKTCQVDEVAKTDRLLAEIEDFLNEESE